MSFNYPSIANNGIPSMLPLLTNMANGNNFLSSLGVTNQSLSGTNLMAAAHQHTPLNDNPLEFNKAAALQQQQQQQQPGAGPMDLENLNDERDISVTHFITSLEGDDVTTNNIRKIGDHRRIDDMTHKTALIDAKDAKKFVGSSGGGGAGGGASGGGSFNQCDIMFNGVMGMTSQSLMMMPGMMSMLDPTSMISMQALPQYSLLNHVSAIQPAATTNLVDQNVSTVTVTTAANNNVSSNSSLKTGPANNVTKETITCNSCVLLPPNPNAPIPTTRERPPGCRTVFVGGLPENITEDIIREIFERCGEITTLRLSKKNFCHIRFVFEASVDSAIYLSGYRVRVNNLSDAPNCGRLHVDYAQARDDQYEWECKQRQLQREQRHRERIERDRLRPLSPPSVIHFSDHEAIAVAEKLKQDETFTKAIQILITWLERGDCSKKNSNVFYSMIQSTNSHVRRLLGEKTTYEDELDKAKESYRKHIHSLSVQFAQIEKVFGAACHKKVWDHFTKAQRKNIDLWKKQSMDIHVMPEPEFVRDADAMDMSEDESDHPIRYGKRARVDSRDFEHMKSDSNSINNNKSMPDLNSDVKDQQLKMLQETIRNLQTQLLDNKMKEKENQQKVSDLEMRLKQANVKELLLKTKIVEATKNSISSSVSVLGSETDDCDNDDIVYVDDDENDGSIDVPSVETDTSTAPKATIDATTPNVAANDAKEITDREMSIDVAHIICLVSTFLVVHPFGATSDNIHSYVQRTVGEQSLPRRKELEDILRQHPGIFRECNNAEGATSAMSERYWKFCGFERGSSATETEKIPHKPPENNCEGRTKKGD